jgi:hypothetical protein
VNSTAEAYDWNTIWGITTIFSIALVVFMMLFFRNDKATQSGKDESQVT